MSISIKAVDSCQVPCILSIAKRKKVTKMTKKAFISDLTWRTKSHQVLTIAPALGVAPDQISIYENIEGMYNLLRKTKRNSIIEFHISSIAVLTNDEQDLINFINMANKRGVLIHSIEEGQLWKTPIPKLPFVIAWRDARRKGAAKKGGEIKADKSEKEFWNKFSIIKDRWHLGERSNDLLKEAKIGHHDTVRVNLGYTRWEWRRLSDAKRERVLKRSANKVKK